MTRIRGKRIAWLFLLAVDCLVAGAIAEIWTRSFIPVKNTCWRFDERLGPVFCPNQRRTGYVQAGYESLFVTNSLGFHDVERPFDKPPGAYRVQIYGDSLMIGGGVGVEATIPAVVESSIGPMASGWDVEVFNMALLDSTSSALRVYEEIGAGFRPDMVVLNFMDDFPDNLPEVHRRPHHPHHRLAAGGRLELIPPLAKDLSTPWERFKKASRLYRLLANKVLESKSYYRARRLLTELRFRLAGGAPGSAAEPGRDAEAGRRRALVERGWPLTLAILEEFRAQVEGAGARFVLSDGRRFYERNVGSVYDNRDLEDFCRARGIDYVPTYLAMDRLAAAPDRARWFFEDNHPTAAGNARLGEYLAEHLAALLPPLRAEGEP